MQRIEPITLDITGNTNSRSLSIYGSTSDGTNISGLLDRSGSHVWGQVSGCWFEGRRIGSRVEGTVTYDQVIAPTSTIPSEHRRTLSRKMSPQVEYDDWGHNEDLRLQRIEALASEITTLDSRIQDPLPGLLTATEIGRIADRNRISDEAVLATFEEELLILYHRVQKELSIQADLELANAETDEIEDNLKLLDTRLTTLSKKHLSQTISQEETKVELTRLLDQLEAVEHSIRYADWTNDQDGRLLHLEDVAAELRRKVEEDAAVGLRRKVDVLHDNISLEIVRHQRQTKKQLKKKLKKIEQLLESTTELSERLDNEGAEWGVLRDWTYELTEKTEALHRRLTIAKETILADRRVWTDQLRTGKYNGTLLTLMHLRVLAEKDQRAELLEIKEAEKHFVEALWSGSTIMLVQALAHVLQTALTLLPNSCAEYYHSIGDIFSTSAKACLDLGEPYLEAVGALLDAARKMKEIIIHKPI